MKTCGEILRRAGTITPGLTAVLFEGRRLTYGQVFERACRLVNGLYGLGAEKQDRVALLGPNTLESVEQIGALALGGFVRVPLHYGNDLDNHVYMLNDSGATVVIADPESAAALQTRAAQMPALRHIVSFGPDTQVDYDDMLAHAAAEDHHWPVQPEDMIQIGYTGGTTGPSKGTVQTHHSWLDVAMENLSLLPNMDESDAFLAATALTGAAGAYLFPAISRYMHVVITPAFDAPTVLRLIEEHRVSLTVMLPAMVHALAQDPTAGKTDLSSLRIIFLASTSMSERAIREATAVLGDVLLFGYGQSESTPATMLTPKDIRCGLDGDLALLRSVGRPTPRSQVKVVNDEGAEMPPGTDGEVLIQTVGTMREYWRDPDATTAKMASDGFVRTGDVGRMDSRGYLQLLGRADERIVAGDDTAYPVEIENLISANAAVKEVAVVGVAADGGELPCAVLYLHEGSDAETVRQWCDTALSDIRMARVSVRTDPLPKTAVGKILRRAVKEQEAETDRAGQRGHLIQSGSSVRKTQGGNAEK